MENWFDKIPFYATPNEIYQYIKQLVGDIGYHSDIDNDGNITFYKYGDSKKNKTIFIPILIEREEFLITSVDKDKAKYCSNIEIKVNDKQDVMLGNLVVGKLLKREDDKTNNEINLFRENALKTGDKTYISFHTSCKANKLYSRNLKCQLSLYFAIKLLLLNLKSDKNIHFTLSFSKSLAKAHLNRLNAEYIFTIIYDNEFENFKLSKGCGLVYKDSGFIVKPKIKSIYRDVSVDVETQNYFGNSKSLAGYYSISSSGVNVGAVAVPIKNMNSSCEVANLNDINSTIAVFENILNYEV